MNKRTKLYLSFIIFIGLVILGHSCYNAFNQNPIQIILYWVFLAGLCQSFLVVFGKDRYVSVVFAVILAAQLCYGVHFSALVAACSQVFFIYKEKPKTYRHIFSVPAYKTLFNVANFSIATYISGVLMEFISNRLILDMGKVPFILVILLYTMSYAIFNTGMLMLLMSLLNREPFLKLWKDLISWILPNFIAIAPFGYFIAVLYNQNMGPLYIALLIGPLLLARHSFQLYQKSKIQYYKTIKALTAAIEAKDPYTEGHSRRVEMYATQIAKRLGLSDAKIQSIEVAALLHDIGKIGIHDSILNKTGSLCESEIAQIHNHPIIGIKILDDIELPNKSKEIIKHHHERYDGKGYPLGLKGDEVLLEAYILSAADAYDAMTSNRPYRNAMSPKQAMNILIENKGTQFHPDVVDVFVDILKESNLEERMIS